MTSFNKTIQLNGLASSNPNKYPAIDENNTLIAKPALVIALKSVKIDCTERVFEVVLNAIVEFFNSFAKVVYQKGFDNKQLIKLIIKIPIKHIRANS